MTYLIILFLVLCQVTTYSQNKISIISCFGFNSPFSALLFDENASFRDGIHLPYVALKHALTKQGYNVCIAKGVEDIQDSRVIISFHPDIESMYGISSNARRIYVSLEPPVVNAKIFDPLCMSVYDKVIMLCQDYADGKKYFKCNYPQPRSQMIQDIVPFNQKKLCTMVVGNKSSSHPLELYTERSRIIDFFENRCVNDFDLYGFHWPVGYRSYKGSVSDKIDCLRKYKFSICYENTHSVRGYITEKIFDAFFAGCVPIYYGAPDIADYVPKECFIDRRNFKSDDELYDFIKNMNEENYEAYLTNIREFLRSSKMQLFSIENFVNEILKHIEK